MGVVVSPTPNPQSEGPGVFCRCLLPLGGTPMLYRSHLLIMCIPAQEYPPHMVLSAVPAEPRFLKEVLLLYHSLFVLVYDKQSVVTSEAQVGVVIYIYHYFLKKF